jgi:hydrogenase maturation factor HypF (carbamoyltransferase family)
MINLSKTQVSWESQVIAFKWYQNIGDALSHFAHFASFLSEAQREKAFEIIGSYGKMKNLYAEEFHELHYNVQLAPIKTEFTIVKTQPTL